MSITFPWLLGLPECNYRYSVNFITVKNKVCAAHQNRYMCTHLQWHMTALLLGSGMHRTPFSTLVRTIGWPNERRAQAQTNSIACLIIHAVMSETLWIFLYLHVCVIGCVCVCVCVCGWMGA